MTGLTRNLVCASCDCIEHHLRNFEILSVCDASLRRLTVDPSLVPFNFTSGIAELDNLHIMIDPLGVVSSSPSQAPSSVLVCRACQTSLQLTVTCELSLGRTSPPSAAEPDLDRGAAYSPCPSHGSYRSSPKSKCEFLLQLERTRHPPATGHHGITKYLASPVVFVTRHCSGRMGGTACAKHGRIARPFFRESSKNIRRPHMAS